MNDLTDARPGHSHRLHDGQMMTVQPQPNPSPASKNPVRVPRVPVNSKSLQAGNQIILHDIGLLLIITKTAQHCSSSARLATCIHLAGHAFSWAMGQSIKAMPMIVGAQEHARRRVEDQTWSTAEQHDKWWFALLPSKTCHCSCFWKVYCTFQMQPSTDMDPRS